MTIAQSTTHDVAIQHAATRWATGHRSGPSYWDAWDGYLAGHASRDEEVTAYREALIDARNTLTEVADYENLSWPSRTAHAIQSTLDRWEAS